MVAETSGLSAVPISDTLSPRNRRLATSVVRTSDAELTAIQAPAAIDKAPATDTVSPATRTASEFPNAAKKPLTAPTISTRPSFSPRDVSHALRIDLSLCRSSHDLIFMFELVLEDVPNRRTQRSIAVGAPDPQILPHTVDLYRLQHEMNRGRPEKPADGHE